MTKKILKVKVRSCVEQSFSNITIKGSPDYNGCTYIHNYS